MTPLQLSKLWFVLSLALLYYALNSYVATQGGESIFDAKIISTGKAAAAVTAIPICSFLLLVSSAIGWLHAKRKDGAWHARIPIVGFDEIDTASREGRAYQAANLTIFSLLPALSLPHFWFTALGYPVAYKVGAPVEKFGLLDLHRLTTLDNPARICSEAPVSMDCEKGVTVLPGLEPAIFAILTLLAFGALVGHWWAVIQSRKTYR